MQILYCRIGWMSFYRGLRNDTILNGGTFKDKFEIYNFMPHHDKFLGFVEPSGSIHVEKLGADKDAEYVDDVLVVWLACPPDEGGLRIIGWYKDARVYRELQNVSADDMKLRDDNSRNMYNILAEEAVLLAPEERDFGIDGPGRHAIWYDEKKTAETEVLNYIESYERERESVATYEEFSDKDSTGEDTYIRAAEQIDFLYEKNGLTDQAISPEKEQGIRNIFKKQYGPEALLKYSGISVWDRVWEHGEGGMIYALRNDDQFRNFGSAKSQDVASLPMHLTRDGNYYAGRNNEILGQSGAIAYGEKFRNKFVACVKAIEKRSLETVEDFIELGEYLDENLDGKGKQMWVHKYLHMLYPDKFSQFHSDDFKRDALCALGIVPLHSYYGMAGQLYQIKKNTNINDFSKFAQVMYKNFPGIGKAEIYVINALDSDISEIRKWQPNSEVDVKTELFSNLFENARFQKKTEKDDPNHLYVVAHNNHLIGIIDNLRPKTSKDKTTERYGIWHACFGENDCIVQDFSKNRSKPISDPEKIILIYSRYYNSYYKPSELENILRKNIEKATEEYNEVLKGKIDKFLKEYPKNSMTLQTRFKDNGILDFYANLSDMYSLDGQKVDCFAAAQKCDLSELTYWSAMLILNNMELENSLVPSDVTARILAIYDPSKYFAFTDIEVIDLSLEELGIPFSSKQSVWIKQNLLRGWLQEKLARDTEDYRLQNYIFVRSVKQWLGLEFYKPKPVRYASLKPINSKVKHEYEAIDRSDDELAQNTDAELDNVEYLHVPQEKVLIDKKDSTGKQLPKRDPAKRRNAMIIADYKCEINPEHETFISRATGKPYVETHHFIPLEFYDDFDFSLDVEENIVCLCSNCHNEIHYGENNSMLVHKLYDARKELLHEVGLDITEDELLRMAYNSNEE